MKRPSFGFSLSNLSNCSPEDADNLDLGLVEKRKPRTPKRKREQEEIFEDKECSPSPKKKIKSQHIFEAPQAPMVTNTGRNFESVFDSEFEQELTLRQAGGEREKVKEELLSFDLCKRVHDLGKDIEPAEFKAVTSAFVKAVQAKELGLCENWLNRQAPKTQFFSITNPMKNNIFFGQKILLESLDSVPELAIHGDIHGDVDSFITFINSLVQKGYLQKDNQFKICEDKKNFYIVLLGDYVGRGDYSFKVLYLLMRLKIENPHRVILLRGNHENVSQNKDFNFVMQVSNSLGDMKNIQTIYNLFPSFVFFGVKNSFGFANYLLLCHGGLEPRFNPHELLADSRPFVCQCINKLNVSWLKKADKTLMQKITSCNNSFKKIVEWPQKTKQIGFIWNDFIVDDGAKYMQKATSRGRNILAFGKSATRALLNAYCSENYAVVTVFTGHQHSDREMKKKLKMNGIYNLWAHSNLRGNILKIIDEFPVWTLNASPHHNGNRVGSSVYYGHDTYVLFNFKDWALKVINTIVSKKSKRDTSDLFG